MRVQDSTGVVMSAARILIIDDDRALSQQVSGLLRERGFSTREYHDGQQGLLAALSETFDLILLDVMLPTLNGFMVLNRLRKSRQTPVMMLTACNAEAERIEGLSKGADDYLPKPFNFTEMALRVEALLRRTVARSAGGGNKGALVVEELTLHRARQQVQCHNQAITLTPVQFRLLWVLVENRNDVLSKPYLYQTVLGRPISRYDRSLDMHLSRVRRKLVDAGMAQERLSTVHGKGYMFA